MHFKMKNKIIYLVFVALAIFQTSSGQSFLNGDFEDNTALVDQINLPNGTYNNFMANSFAFGNYGGGGPNGGNMDIITSSDFCGSSAQQGNWYVGLSGAGTDAISLKLSAPLVAGHYYTISFYDRGADPIYQISPFSIGLSNVEDGLGFTLYVAPIGQECEWTLRTFSFFAPFNGAYITVHMPGGGLPYWCHVDNFTIEEITSVPSTLQENGLSVFPNPANDMVNVELPESAPDVSQLLIYNSMGQMVKNVEVMGAKGTFSVGDLPVGMYYIRVENAQNNFIKLLIFK